MNGAMSIGLTVPRPHPPGEAAPNSAGSGFGGCRRELVHLERRRDHAVEGEFANDALPACAGQPFRRRAPQLGKAPSLGSAGVPHGRLSSCGAMAAPVVHPFSVVTLVLTTG